MLDELRLGRWKPGERLPGENELAAAYNVSRPVVREALRRLEAGGIVQVAQGRGTFVLEPEARQVLPEQALTLLFASPERAQSVHEARLALELGLTELAAARATEDDLRSLRELTDRAAQAIEHPTGTKRERELVELGLAFHLRVAEAARSPVLAQLYALITDPLVRSVERPHARHGNPKEDLAFHIAVTDALARHDAAAAVTAMRTHVERTTAIVLAGE